MPCAVNSLYSTTARVIRHIIQSAIFTRGLPGLILAIVWLATFGSFNVSAQTPNVEFNNKTVDFGDRGDLKVNPSTLGMEIQLPLGNDPGRAGTSLAVTLSYSSKLWRFDYAMYNPGHYTSSGAPIGDGYTGVVARYAEHSMSGWTSSMGFPFLDGAPPQYYDNTGYPKPDVNSCGGSGCYTVDRLTIWMPDGSSHEFRSSDQPHSVNDHTPLPDDLYAVDGSRMRYQRSTQTLFMPDGSRYQMGGVNKYVDRNGNTLTYDANHNQWLDTLNRPIGLPPVSMPGANFQPTISPGSYPYSLPGVNNSTVSYTFVWKNLGDPGVLTTSQPLQYIADTDCSWGNVNSPHLFASDSGSRTCILNANTPFNPTVLYQIVLPTGQAYTFTYDIYGEIDKVQLPTGGYERYVYGNVGSIDTLVSPYRQANRGVTDRYVSASGTGSDEAHWQYAGGGVSPITITAPDNSQTVRYINATVGVGPPTAPWSYDPATNGTAYDERYYSAPDGGGVRHMLRRKLTDWATTGSNAAGGVYNANLATRNPRISRQVMILLDTSGDALAKSTTYGYDTTYQFDVGVDQTSTTEYDYTSVDQNTAQTGAISSISTGTTVLRKTQTSYLTSNSSYRLRNILGLQTSMTVQNASGGTVAQSTMSYDESAYQLGNTYGAVTQWSDPAAVRGNVTTINRWVDTTNTWLSTHAQYDQAGSVVSTWDANGNQTQTAYSSTYAYAYPTSATSAVPDTTNTYGSNTPLTTSATYDFSTGLVTSSTDANGKTTTFDYTDPLDRIKLVTRPDGGTTTYTYDRATNAGLMNDYVRTLTSLDSSRSTDSYQFFDGLGRPARSFVNEGGSPAVFITSDTQYDSMGRAYRVSNPYRTNGSGDAINPSGQWTTTGFDALGRPTSITTPDGAVVATSYSGNSMTVTDQTGKKRSSVSDALGRLTQVTEDPTTGGLNYVTNYTYDVLGNLRKVDQGGQLRYFMYDSLSHLIRAKNPEQAAGSVASNITDPITGNTQWSLAYGYDNDGNLTARVDARNITTNYTYDHLNRNITVTHTGESVHTPDVNSYYDGATNGRGRLYWTQTIGVSATVFDSYDVIGRPTLYHQVYWVNGAWGQNYNVSRAYDKAGNVTSQTYPSGHVVNYNYDIAGRLADNGSQLAFTGNIGDGVSRTYSTGISYSTFGGIQQEQFATQTALYHKLHYNKRGQLYDIRLSTNSLTANEWDWNRGALVNYYSSNYAWEGNPSTPAGTDNNGNLMREQHWVPNDDAISTYSYTQDTFSYDSLNRVSSATELHGTQSSQSGQDYAQVYTYDRFGNRTINQSQTSGAPNTQFTVDTATNRLGVPAGQTGSMSYDGAGNLTFDSYTGQGSRGYDAENRMTSAQDSYNGTSTYTYDADGHRIKRANIYGETWQVYGIGGELLAEYKSGAAPYLPTKEYGYRSGELLVTMTSGNDQRLQQFVTNLYYGALQRDPTSTELQNGVNQLAAAGVQGQSQLQTSAAQLARSLFTSTSYETSPSRTDQQYVADLYNTYLQRGPDSSGLGFWTGQAAGGVTNRTNVCNAFEASGEFQTLVATLYGTATSDNQRTESFVNNFFLGAYGRNATTTELQTNRDALNAAAAVGQSNVQSQAETMGRSLFASQVTNMSITDAQYVTNLYEGFLQRGPDSSGLSFWTGQAAGGSTNRQHVLDAFATSTAFRSLSGALYRETYWLVGDHLGTPRMVVDKSGSLAGVKRHDYLPFGEELSAGTGGRTTTQGYSVSDNVRQKFTRQERDAETGLDYFVARYYSSVQGRFSAIDPHGPWNMKDEERNAFLGDPRQWNRYTYVSNNPLVYTDPTGLERYAGMSQADEQRIRAAIDAILKDGDKDQKRIAQLIRDSDVTITIASDNNPQSHTDLTNVSLAKQLIKGGCDDVTSAAGSFTITLSKSDANNQQFGTATIDTTLVHEGQHLEVTSKMIAGLATLDPKQRSDITFAGNETQSKLQAAYYMQRKGGVYHQLGLQIGLLEQRGSNIIVPAGRIRAETVKQFGKDANKSVLRELVKTLNSH